MPFLGAKSEFVCRPGISAAPAIVSDFTVIIACSYTDALNYCASLRLPVSKHPGCRS